MAFNDCVHLREEKNDYGQNICPYSPATSFACPYGSIESASAYCPKYTNGALSAAITTLTGQHVYYKDDSKQAKEPLSLTPLVYLKKAHYYLGKAIESMERENNNE